MNAPLTRHQGIAAPLLLDNVNTDMIIPSREMRRVSKAGLGDGLFANLRYGKNRDPNPEFILNQPPYDSASILISGDNFGCGSSREHAVWALYGFGIRAIIAESYGSIFQDNCFANGIAVLELPRSEIRAIVNCVNAEPKGNLVAVNLVEKTVVADGTVYPFDMNENARQMLMDGTSPIDMTLQHRNAIDGFYESDRLVRSWLYAANAR